MPPRRVRLSRPGMHRARYGELCRESYPSNGGQRRTCSCHSFSTIGGMTLKERAELALSLAQVLHVNGQSTEETVAATERLGNTLGLRGGIIPRWGELQCQAGDGDAEIVSIRPADPIGMDMDRVVSAMRAVEDLDAGRLAPSALHSAFRTISQTPPAPTWLFALAAAAGAAALAVLYGVQHLAAVALIMVSAASGAVLRRAIGRYSTNALLQPLCTQSQGYLLGQGFQEVEAQLLRQQPLR